MNNSKLTCIFFGLWIGLLVSGSIVVELYLQGQVYSYRTVIIVAILSVTGIFSSIISWWLLSRLGRSLHATSIILCLANIILFILIGSAVSFVAIEIIPEFFETGQDPDHSIFRRVFTGVVPGFLGAAFSFKTFGLVLLWPLGVISGLAGTFLFVHINNRMKTSAGH